MKKVKSVFLCALGQIVVFDEEGQQIPELQENALSSWAKDAERKGYDLSEAVIETQNSGLRSKFFKTNEGRWNTQQL